MKRWLIFFLFMISAFDVKALSVGSDTVCSREGAILFPQGDSNNEMNGFAFFEGGVALENQLTTCIFDSFFPVSGVFDAACGTFLLQKDLTFDEGASIACMGSVYGNGHSINLSQSITSLTAQAYFVALTQRYQVAPADKPVFSTDWSPDGNYVVAVIESASGNDMFVYSVNRITSSLTFRAGTYLSGSGFSVRWNPAVNYIAVGSDKPGEELRVFPYNTSTNTIGSPRTVDLAGNGKAVSWNKNGNYLAVGTNSATRYLYCYPFSKATGTLGSSLTINTQPGGEVSPDALDWDATGNYLAVGITNASGSNLLLYYLQNETTLTLTHQVAIPGATTVRALDWSKTDSYLMVGLADGEDRLRVYHFNPEPGHWTFEEKTACCIDDTKCVDSGVLSVHWNNDGTVAIVGLATQVGHELQAYSFDGDRLRLVDKKEFSTNVNSVRWDYDGSHVVCGDSLNKLTVFSVVSSFADTVLLDTLFLNISNDVSWKMMTLVQGDCTIDGCGNRITLVDNGKILLTSGAQLTIKNTELSGLCEYNAIWCYDDTATLVLKNCTVSLVDDFEFSKGSLVFDRDVKFLGPHQFTYSSGMVSTISAQSKLLIDQGATFFYAPSVVNRDLLHMVDKTSCLYCNGCILKSTVPGMRLTRGRLFFDNAVTFSCEGTIGSEAICFGDGVSDHDVDITLLSGSQVTVYGGLYDNNVG